MQLTERQANAAIYAIVLKHYPNFHALPDESKTSVGQATYWWFNRVLAPLPEDTASSELAADHWEHIKTVASDYIVGTIRTQHPEHAKASDDKIKNCISLSDLENQALVFLHLAKVGLEALTTHREFESLANAMASGDVDLNLALQELVAREG